MLYLYIYIIYIYIGITVHIRRAQQTRASHELGHVIRARKKVTKTKRVSDNEARHFTGATESRESKS